MHYDQRSFEEITAEPITELQELESIYCEMHKDVYGVKARWYRADSVEQARADIEALGVQLARQQEIEAAEEKAAARAFEARIDSVIELGAGDRQTALKWIHEAEQTDGDNEYLCYKLGLPYNYLKV